MKKYLLSAVTVAIAIAAVPAFVSMPAQAQKAPVNVTIVVETDRIYRDCTACKAAQAALKTQADAIQARQQALGASLKGESQALQTAVDALAGKEPDAALKQRIQAFQAKQAAAEQEIGRSGDTFNRNRAFVGQQIKAKLDPLITATMKARGANMAVDAQQIYAFEPALNATDAVLAQLNAVLPSVSTTAPAPPAAPAPAGR
jgi:outer membrane protein